MITKAQTLKLVERLLAIRSTIVEFHENLGDHHHTAGSAEAQRLLKCAAEDLYNACSALRVEAVRS